MGKFILLTLITLGTITCSNNNSNPKVAIGKAVNQNLITYQISNSNVFSTVPEQVKNGSFNTISHKEGFMTSKLRSRLGKFEDAKNLDLDIQFTRKTENPKFEIGSFNLAGPEIMLEASISGNNSTFAVVNVLSMQEYEALKFLDKIDELKDKFVFHSNSDNKLIIEKVEDRKEFDIDVTGNYKTGSQLLEGYALIHLLEINSNEVFSIRLDFSVINNILIRI
tara:strand:- start:47494 stop:48162 length:669 start_codon:yes stop_codon:yes gene_type:complete